MTEIERLRYVLGTLITWLGQSSSDPISVREAEQLIEMLSGKEPK